MGEIAVAIADDNERILDLLGEMIENNKIKIVKNKMIIISCGYYYYEYYLII